MIVKVATTFTSRATRSLWDRLAHPFVRVKNLDAKSTRPFGIKIESVRTIANRPDMGSTHSVLLSALSEERKASRKMNKFFGIMNNNKDSATVRHLKNNSVLYSSGVGLAGVLGAKSALRKEAGVVQTAVKSFKKPEDMMKLVQEAITNSKLSPSTKALGPIAEKAIKVVH